MGDDGSNPVMLRTVRMHGNPAEYILIAVLLMLVYAMMLVYAIGPGSPSWR